MPPRRRSFGRILLVAMLVVIALLLLELGRLLPGSWPGGGGDGGSRKFPTGEAPDPTRLVPSTAPPPSQPKPADRGTLHVVVRRTDGTPVEGGSVVVGVAGASASADVIEGEAILRVGDSIPDEWTISLPGPVRIGHGRAPERGDGRYIVTLPRRLEVDTPSASAFGGAASPSVRVVDPDGHPVAGATVAANGPKGEREIETGADGVAAVPDAEGVQRFCVHATGFGESCVYGRLVAGRPLLIRLSPTRMRRTTFVDAATSELLRARSLVLIDRRGVTKRLERTAGVFEEFAVNMPDDVAADTTLEIDVADRPPVRVALSALGWTTAIAAGAPRTVRVLGEDGRPVEGARVTARFSAGPSTDGPATGGSTGPIETTSTTDARGEAAFSLPLDRDTDIVVDSPGFATEGVRVTANTPVDAKPVEVRVARGVDCVVTVADDQGRPMADADVLALFAAGRSTARRRATTDRTGVATLRAIPPGRIEALAHRAGYAWASQTGKSSDGGYRLALVLHPGRRLTLVIEDPAGVPLPGVAIRSVARTPTGGPAGAPTNDATDPDAVLPWETTENGVLVVDDLPDREVDLYLSKSGFDDEVVARVRPGPSTWFATLVRSAPIAPSAPSATK